MNTVAPIDFPELNKPPMSLEAEQAVVGGLLLRNDAWDDVYDIVRKQHFFRRQHSIIFEVFGELYENQIPVDVVTLGEELEKRDLLDVVGGLAYIAEVANNTPSVANIKAYADIVKERAVLRNLIAISQETMDVCFQSHKSS